jgi:hypothetical protein
MRSRFPPRKARLNVWSGVEVTLLHHYKRSQLARRLCNVEKLLAQLTLTRDPPERFFMHKIEGSSRNDGNKLLLARMDPNGRYEREKRLKVKLVYARISSDNERTRRKSEKCMTCSFSRQWFGEPKSAEKSNNDPSNSALLSTFSHHCIHPLESQQCLTPLGHPLLSPSRLFFFLHSKQ